MAPRAVWKGTLKIAELTCPVALYTAASTSERVSFRTLNRSTGNPVRREYVDAETGDPVDKDDQVKGYEIDKDQYVILTPEEMADAVPDSDKILHVEAFLDCPEIDTTYFDRPYYLAPSGPEAKGTFSLIREGMRGKKTAALARTVLFRRVRTVLIRAQGPGLVANTLNFDYEVRPASEAFDDIPEPRIEGEMLDLAQHIIKTKRGTFDPSRFDDRYDSAVAELVKAKREGRKIDAPQPREEGRVVDLMEALRQSARQGDDTPAKKTATSTKKRGTKKQSAKKSTDGKPASKNATEGQGKTRSGGRSAREKAG